MKISLIACSKQEVDFFEELSAALNAVMPDISVEFFYVPSELDIPFQAKKVSGNSDLIAAFYLYSEKNENNAIVLDKLINIELESNTKILKFFEESSFGEALTEEDLQLEKENIAQKFAEIIVNYLHYPEKFKPEIEEQTEEEL
ncbi:MAG TPA: hypothetical protein VJK05_00755 [archaeon]|nr:hypothetical protein [archaeon]